VVTGLADACQSNACALIGRRDGADAGLYAEGEYDLAGFIVGAVDRDKMVTGAGIKAGDVLIGLPSTGLAHQRLFAGPQALLPRWPATSTRNT